MKIISLFTGAGGLDLGFKKAGFETVWANENDKSVWETFEHNFPNTVLDKRSVRDLPSCDIPDDIDGVIAVHPARVGVRENRKRASMMKGVGFSMSLSG